MPELALDDDHRDALAGHLDRVAQLVGREPAAHPGSGGGVGQLDADRGRAARVLCSRSNRRVGDRPLGMGGSRPGRASPHRSALSLGKAGARITGKVARPPGRIRSCPAAAIAPTRDDCVVAIAIVRRSVAFAIAFAAKRSRGTDRLSPERDRPSAVPTLDVIGSPFRAEPAWRLTPIAWLQQRQTSNVSACYRQRLLSVGGQFCSGPRVGAARAKSRECLQARRVRSGRDRPVQRRIVTGVFGGRLIAG